jgi:predicted small secreted protein
MKKNLILSLLFLLSTLLFVSCSTTSGTNVDVKTADYTYFTPMSLKEVHNLIKEAGEESGWRMTEFKEHEMIAEKTENGTTKAVTIDFGKNYFHIEPDNSNLQDALEDNLGI